MIEASFWSKRCNALGHLGAELATRFDSFGGKIKWFQIGDASSRNSKLRIAAAPERRYGDSKTRIFRHCRERRGTGKLAKRLATKMSTYFAKQYRAARKRFTRFTNDTSSQPELTGNSLAIACRIRNVPINSGKDDKTTRPKPPRRRNFVTGRRATRRCRDVREQIVISRVGGKTRKRKRNRPIGHNADNFIDQNMSAIRPRRTFGIPRRIPINRTETETEAAAMSPKPGTRSRIGFRPRRRFTPGIRINRSMIGATHLKKSARRLRPISIFGRKNFPLQIL